MTSSPRFLTEHLVFPESLGVCVSAQRLSGRYPQALGHSSRHWHLRVTGDMSAQGDGSSFWRTAGPTAAAGTGDLLVC